MKKANSTKKKLGGLSTPKVVIPVAVILAILHALIVFVITIVDDSSAQMAALINDYENYSAEATAIVKNSSVLSETASGYCVMPEEEETGNLRVSLLLAYVRELNSMECYGDCLIVHFDEYDVGENIKKSVFSAANEASRMMAAQRHAIALICVDHPFSEEEYPELAALPRYELSREELELSPKERSQRAYNLLYGNDYTDWKTAVFKNVEAATAALRKEMQDKSSKQISKFSIVRKLLWAEILSAITILLIAFFYFLKNLIYPLSKYAKQITSGKKIEQNKGMLEVRLLATAYNDLLERQNELENALRVAAETDALTRLPNRLSFENRYITKVGESGYSAAVFFFDINYLKTINDGLGHSAGDMLLINAARTISACFSKEGENNCFRVGGDEFAAVLTGCNENEIKDILLSFEKEQEKNNVSIAVGYAFTPDVGNSSFRDLFADADKKMYVEKIAMHNRK
ncbi:MAG: GGDEF domain-containing protein [Clostridia bacterium]|nr:GGDEF domain-containing protein [Clostridia bacterium]